jgi:hypothetical protein
VKLLRYIWFLLAATAMANYVSNIAKGRIVELFNRVDTNEPANSAIILIPLKTAETEANAQDFASVKTFLEGTADEQTEGWSRKTLTDADLAAIAVDNANNRFPASIPAVKWTAPTAGKNTKSLLVAYDADTTGGDDSNLIPLVHLDFEVTADGNDVEINAGEILRAS